MSRASDPLLVAKGPPPKWDEDPEFVTVNVEGHSFVVAPGVTRITQGHPLAKARPDLFKADKGTAHRV